MTTKIQSLVFSRSMFGPSEARAWAKDHDFTAAKVDIQKNTVRIRQLAPSSFQKDSFRTIELRKGVKAVIGVPKVKRRPARRNPQDPSRYAAAVGQCYPWATRFAWDKDGAVVVHGTIVGPDRQGRIRPLEHAWVEWRGKVYDWQTVEVMKKSPMSISEWRRKNQTREEYRLTDEEASICALRSRHHGPWTEAERAFLSTRKSSRLASDVDYQAVQQFLDDLPTEIELSVWEALDIMNEHLSGKYRGEPTFIVEHADVEVDEDEEGRSLVIWSGDITDYETGDVVGFISFMEHWPMPNVVWE